MRLNYSAISDVGRVRKDNQDSGYAGPWLLAVCDGVGGAARGDIASSTAIQQLRQLDERARRRPARPGRRRPAPRPRPDRRARRRGPRPQRHQHHRHRRALRRRPLGIGHVGDSRAYLFRDGEISQLTNDHTFVQTLIDEGRITEEESRVHPHRNLILKALDGDRTTPSPTSSTSTLAPGDRILLCSDGACGVLDDDRLADILVAPAAPTTPRSSWSAPASRPAAPTTSPASSPTSSTATTRSPPTCTRCWSAPPPSCRVARARTRRRGRRPLPRPPLRRHRRARADHAEIPDDVPFAIANDPIDPEEPRYAPRPPAPLRLAQAGSWAGASSSGCCWVGLAAAWSWSQQQYYVGEQDGAVAIFRGVNADLPGIELSTPYETTDVELDRLPDFDADKVREGIEAGSLDEAHEHRRQPAERQSPTPRPTQAGRC